MEHEKMKRYLQLLIPLVIGVVAGIMISLPIMTHAQEETIAKIVDAKVKEEMKRVDEVNQQKEASPPGTEESSPTEDKSSKLLSVSSISNKLSGDISLDLWKLQMETGSIEETKVTEQPKTTEEPNTTGEPEVTEKPKETEVPKETEKPKETYAPEETEKPETTEEPEATEKPKEAGKPEVTEQPKTTTEPNTTGEPVVSNNPEKTEKAETTEKGITVKAIRDIKMYEEDDEDSKVLKEIDRGEKLTNVEESGYGWLKATYRGKEGYVYYMYTSYLEVIGRDEVVYKSEMNGTQGEVIGESINLRKKAGINSKVIGVVDMGTMVEIISYEELIENEEFGWYKVKTIDSNQVGYVYGEYLDIEVVIEIPSETQVEDEEMLKEDHSGEAVDNKNVTSNEATVSKEDKNSETTVSKNATANKTTESKESGSKKGTECKAVTSNKVTTSKEDEDEKNDGTKDVVENKADVLKEDKNKQRIRSKKETVSKEDKPKEEGDNKVKESDINLLAKVMIAEAGGSGDKEMKYAGQTLVNRVTINKSSLEKELARPNQYPWTYRKIQQGKIKATKHVKNLAKKILQGENGFEGSGISKAKWDKIYYQTSVKPSWAEVVIYTGNHYYSI